MRRQLVGAWTISFLVEFGRLFYYRYFSVRKLAKNCVTVTPAYLFDWSSLHSCWQLCTLFSSMFVPFYTILFLCSRYFYFDMNLEAPCLILIKKGKVMLIFNDIFNSPDVISDLGFWSWPDNERCLYIGLCGSS